MPSAGICRRRCVSVAPAGYTEARAEDRRVAGTCRELIERRFLKIEPSLIGFHGIYTSARASSSIINDLYDDFGALFTSHYTLSRTETSVAIVHVTVFARPPRSRCRARVSGNWDNYSTGMSLSVQNV